MRHPSRRSSEKPASGDLPEKRPISGLRTGLFILVAIFLLLAITFVWKQRAGAPGKPGTINAKIGRQDFVLDVSDTPESRQQGLSGRQFMSKNEGMLFVYEKPERQCIWMKDMNFNLDIVWADRDKTVTHIESNVSPHTYPKNFCGGLAPSKYVIELNSGVAAEAGLALGDKLDF